MTKTIPEVGSNMVLAKEKLHDLIAALTAAGYRVIGPRLDGAAIVYEPIESASDLPQGWRDRQEAGRYRLEKSDRPALFDYVVGPHSWKRYLFPSHQLLWKAKRRGQGFEIEPQRDAEETRTPRYAFFGARACEIRAMQIQDRVFNNEVAADPDYRERRRAAFIVAVNCASPADTCFCASLDTGPEAREGFDLALTEVLDERRHEFLVAVGSERGAEIIAGIGYRPAERADKDRAAAISARAVEAMKREMPADAETLLKRNPDHSRWEEVAERCLACGNCTLVCPTCFCTTVEDTTDLGGDIAERWRRWDSCFNTEFSYLHGGSIRSSGRSKYRQWLTHKLAYWHDQFGSSGCVGCGRCITWCPVGIDITEEVKAFQDAEGSMRP